LASTFSVDSFKLHRDTDWLLGLRCLAKMKDVRLVFITFWRVFTRS
jgi:hypothetical protein